MKTATVLLDTLSLYHAIRYLCGGKIDYGRLIADIERRFDIESLIAYVLDVKENAPFVKMLEAKGVQVEHHSEDSYGIALAVDALSSKSEYVVVATANSYFVPLFLVLGNDVVVYTPDGVPNGIECVTINDRLIVNA